MQLNWSSWSPTDFDMRSPEVAAVILRPRLVQKNPYVPSNRLAGRSGDQWKNARFAIVRGDPTLAGDRHVQRSGAFDGGQEMLY